MTIECPKCHIYNPDSQKFCGVCATPKPGIQEAIHTKILETPKEELIGESELAKKNEIIEELVKGGIGRVYSEEDKRIKKEIALKLINPENASDKNTIERFRNKFSFIQKIEIYIAFLLMLILVGCRSPTSPDDLPGVEINLFPAYGLSSATSCSRTRIKVIYFVPKGQEANIYPGWRAAADIAFTKIQEYFQREFRGYLTIRFDILQDYVAGQQTEYSSINEANQEIHNAVFSPDGDYYNPLFANESLREYTVIMVYYVNGAGGNFVKIPSGAYVLTKYAYNPWFWLENLEKYGLVNSAHEFGHLLGMPHPWEMEPPYPNDRGNLMGYNCTGLTLTQCFILDEVKRLMGLPD